MKEFIDELISKDLSFDEIRDEFSKFGYSDDYEVYSKFTKDDYDVRDEFLVISNKVRQTLMNYVVCGVVVKFSKFYFFIRQVAKF